MATVTVRGLDDEVKAQLRIRAARHGRSMEAEVRAILRDAVTEPASTDDRAGLGTRIRARAEAVGGVDLDLPDRRDLPRAATFEP